MGYWRWRRCCCCCGCCCCYRGCPALTGTGAGGAAAESSVQPEEQQAAVAKQQRWMAGQVEQEQQQQQRAASEAAMRWRHGDLALVAPALMFLIWGQTRGRDETKSKERGVKGRRTSRRTDGGAGGLFTPVRQPVPMPPDSPKQPLRSS